MSAVTVPAVRAALKARLVAMLAAAGDTAVVIYGPPGQNIPRRYIAVADTESGVQREQHTLPLRGSSSRTETYDLRLVIWCFTADPEQQQAVTEDAWALAARVDADLRGEVTLGGVVTSALPVSFIDSDFLLNEGRAAQVIVLVNINANRT